MAGLLELLKKTPAGTENHGTFIDAHFTHEFSTKP